MSRFLVDNQLPAALARWLRDQGHDAEHALELDLAQAPDRFLWHYAAKHGAVIVTKDEDFAQMVTLRPEPVSVVWLRIGNCRTPVLLALFAAALPAITVQLADGTLRWTPEVGQRGWLSSNHPRSSHVQETSYV